MTAKKIKTPTKAAKNVPKPRVSDGYVTYTLNEDVPMELTTTLAEAHTAAKEMLDDWDDDVSIAEISIVGTYKKPVCKYEWQPKTQRTK